MKTLYTPGQHVFTKYAFCGCDRLFTPAFPEHKVCATCVRAFLRSFVDPLNRRNFDELGHCRSLGASLQEGCSIYGCGAAWSDYSIYSPSFVGVLCTEGHRHRVELGSEDAADLANALGIDRGA